jgi:hypothetical protein
MNTSIKRMVIRGFLCASIPGVYLGAWYAYRFTGIAWPNAFNIPGFIFLMLSSPWSIGANTLIGSHGHELGEFARVLKCAAVAFGFGLNATLLISGVGYAVKRITRRWTPTPNVGQLER